MKPMSPPKHRFAQLLQRPAVPVRAAVLGAAAWLALPLCAWSASKDIERVQLQIAGLQGQINDLARTLDDTLRELRRLNEGLAEQNALLKKSVADGHVDNEALRTSLKELSDRVGENLERLEQRMTALAHRPLPEGGPPAVVDAGLPPGSPAPPPPAGTPAGDASPAPRELYSQAYADYARGNYDLAIQGFQEYLRTAPGSELADNAQYWIGECLYGKQRYSDAVEAWNALLRDYPASDKLPDARVKKAMALERMGRRSQALIEYRFVIDRYPGSSAARIARDKLNAN